MATDPAMLTSRLIRRAATREVADVALEYLPPERLGLAQADVPRSTWPPPRRHLWPFGARQMLQLADQLISCPQGR